MKLGKLNEKIKEWVAYYFGDVQAAKASILEELQSLDRKEELGLLSLEEGIEGLPSKSSLLRKLERRKSNKSKDRGLVDG